jgi:signal peptidase II
LDAEAVPPGDVASVRRARLPFVAGVAAMVLALDQLSKAWALEELADGHVVDLFWTLRFNLTSNTGAAFSLGGDSGAGPWIALGALLVVGVLMWTGRTMDTKLGTVSVGLVLGGALGNLCDRAFRGEGFMDGAVVDFIDPQWWPVFNVADMGVVVGGLLLAWVGFRQEA